MRMRFERNIENPERRIEEEGEFLEKVTSKIIGDDLEDPYEDEFDEMLDEAKHQTKPAQKDTFTQSIKVEQSKIEDTELIIAYQELDRARRSRIKEDIIRAEDRILDIERNEEEKEYHLRIAQLKEMQRKARETGNKQDMEQFKKRRRAFITEMKYDELIYKINKLQNAQRLEPREKRLQQLIELKKELREVEKEAMDINLK